MNTSLRAQQQKRISYQMITRLFGGVLICVICAYIYGILSTTLLVQKKNALESEIQKLQSEISEKEMSYLALARVLDESALVQHGFHQATNVHFVSRDRTDINTIALARPTTR